MDIDRIPSNSLKPEVPEDLIDRGFSERDAEMMANGLLRISDEVVLRQKLEFIAAGLPSQRFVSQASGEGEALLDAADHDLLRFADLCRSLAGETMPRIKEALTAFRAKELERKNGFSPQP